LKSSHQLSKYNWINFSSKQRSFYFTKSSRGPDSISQRAGFGPRAVCLTPLVYTDQLLCHCVFICSNAR